MKHRHIPRITVEQWLDAMVARMADDDLRCELECYERCTLLSTRARRDVALQRVRCLKRELARREQARNVSATTQESQPATKTQSAHIS